MGFGSFLARIGCLKFLSKFFRRQKMKICDFLPGLQKLESFDEGPFHGFQVLNFLEGADFGPGLGNFGDVVNFDVARFGQFQIIYVLLTQTVFLMVLRQKHLFLGGSHFVTLVDQDAAVFPESLFGHIIFENEVNVDVQAKETGKALHAHHPLQLKVAQRNIFGG